MGNPEENDPANGPPRRLRAGGGYRQLASFQMSTVVYDATVRFCQRFVDRQSRTVDQMVQAARSGRQNIAEGSRAASTSAETELKLVNVARASLDELLLDYEDFLRQRAMVLWASDSTEAQSVRRVAQSADPRTRPVCQADYARWLDSSHAEVVANAIVCLIHQTNYLLDRQLVALEEAFRRHGGFREQLTRARREYLAGESTTSTAATEIRCPRCGGAMVMRVSRQEPGNPKNFWGCTGYPTCRGTRPWRPKA